MPTKNPTRKRASAKYSKIATELSKHDSLKAVGVGTVREVVRVLVERQSSSIRSNKKEGPLSLMVSMATKRAAALKGMSA